jgi:hypothetical protein
MEEESKFIMDFSIEDIHLLYDCVCRRIQNWEGAPSRHPFEQEHLSKLKSELYKAILDFKFYDES